LRECSGAVPVARGRALGPHLRGARFGGFGGGARRPLLLLLPLLLGLSEGDYAHVLHVREPADGDEGGGLAKPEAVEGREGVRPRDWLAYASPVSPEFGD